MPVPPEGAVLEAATGLRRELGLWDLVLLNVVAIVGLRWWLTSAGGYGYAALPLWVLAFLCFFVPSGLAVIDLTTRYPEEGGIYAWTKHAFGDDHGFISGWCLWTNNLVYFPHLLIFTVGNLVFMLGEKHQGLAASPPFMAAMSLAIFWVVVWFNVLGLRHARWLNNLGAYGTWLPATILIALGGFALFKFGAATPFGAAALLPVFSLGTVSFFSAICFGFSGLDLGALMGEEIIEPRKNLPRAILISGVIITLIYVLGTAALLVALPQQNIGLLDGVAAAIAAVPQKMGFGFLAGIGSRPGGNHPRPGRSRRDAPRRHRRLPDHGGRHRPRARAARRLEPLAVRGEDPGRLRRPARLRLAPLQARAADRSRCSIAGSVAAPGRPPSHASLHLLSEWPRSLPGATRSRTSCFSSLSSGKRPCACRDQRTSSPRRTSNTPPVPGRRATSLSSASKVVKSSWAIQAARRSQRHCVQ